MKVNRKDYPMYYGKLKMFQTTNQVCMKEPRKNRGLKNGLGNVNHLRFVG